MYSFYTDFCFAVFTVLFSVISWYCILKKSLFMSFICVTGLTYILSGISWFSVSMRSSWILLEQEMMGWQWH